MNSKPGPAPKKKDETSTDLEQQFILRLPPLPKMEVTLERYMEYIALFKPNQEFPGTAMALKHDIESGSMILKDKLMIELQSDMRHSRVMYGGQIFNAKLLDLPCVVESLKTTDNKTFYKTADISQMLVCNVGEDESEEEDGKKNDKKYQFPHGVTPPLKNVRKRRFRKTLKKKNSDMPDIEKEVKRLFRMDNEAIDIKWEVVIEGEKTNDPSNAQVLAQGETSRVPVMKRKGIPLEIPSLDEALAEHDIFGDVSESDDDDMPEAASDGDIMKAASKKIFGDVSDSDNEEKMELSYNGPGDMSMDLQAQPGIDYSQPTAGMTDNEVQVHSKLSEIVANLNATREKRLELENERDTSPIPFGPEDDICKEINALLEQEAQLEREYQFFAAMINQG